MSNTYGENLKLTIFGSSHGVEIGMNLEGIPAGLPVNMEDLQHFLNRRAPGRNAWSTARKEADIPQFRSGLADGITTGEMINAVIKNENVHPKDYDELKYIPRPGHADFSAWMKYGLDYDMAGGGPFSGRMTAPLCIAGGLCKQWLEEKGIRIGAHIAQIGLCNTKSFDFITPDLDSIDTDFPTLKPEDAENFQALIQKAKAEGDSVGGRIECAIVGLPAGLGGVLFGGVESKLAQILYAIPAVKNVGFGWSDSFAIVPGSESNDPFVLSDGQIRTQSNHCGGILGGITTGMPVIFDVTIKPTPSIAKPQKSVNMKTMEEVTIKIKGRHDPCIVPRAVPVVEAAAAIAIYDLMLGGI